MEEENRSRREVCSTPVSIDGGVAFMTPSSSSGRPLYPLVLHRVLPPLPKLEWPPTPPVAPGQCEFVDVVTELWKKGVPAVVEKIFSYLSTKDLVQCAMVCTNWNTFLSEFNLLSTPLPIPHPAAITPLVTTRNPTRDTLATLDMNIRHTPPLTPIPPPPSRGAQRMHTRICPQCTKTAKVLNQRRATCLSRNCNFDFCMQCFRQWHEGKCIQYEGSKTSDYEIAGNKKSKKRLKRL